MEYFVSRQCQWMTGANVVEIAAGGLDYSGPDMLCTSYGDLGEELETNDPREALEAAIAIRDTWNKQLSEDNFSHIEAGYNLDMITPTEEPTDKQLREWAQTEWGAAPKCYWCNEVIETPYIMREAGDSVQFCSECCADRCWAEEINGEQPHTRRHHD